MKQIYRRCCEIDVHKATLTPCVHMSGLSGKLSQDMRRSSTVNDKLLSLRDWSSVHSMSDVATEATEVYWKPVLQTPGFQATLI
jgi:transposase